MSSTQTLSPGGVPQEGSPRFSSPLTAAVAVAHEGIHPIHMPPPPMVALVTLEGKGYSRGRCPVSRFPWMEKCVKLPRFSTHRGNSPDSRLFPSNNLCRVEIPPSWGGIGPVSPLFSSRRFVRLARFPSSGGIDPVRLLPSKYSSWRLARFPSWGGIDPVSLLLPMPSTKSADSCPSSGGIVPFSGSGEVAVRMRIPRTRFGVPANSIPVQLDIAVVAFQLRVAVPRSVSLAAQRALQSAMSPVFV